MSPSVFINTGIVTNVSEDSVASILRVEIPRDGSSRLVSIKLHSVIPQKTEILILTSYLI
jgi:hypothetical protein